MKVFGCSRLNTFVELFKASKTLTQSKRIVFLSSFVIQLQFRAAMQGFSIYNNLLINPQLLFSQRAYL